MAVEIVLTSRMKRAFEYALDKENLPTLLREKLRSHKEKTEDTKQRENCNRSHLITFSLLREVWEFLRQSKSPEEEPIYLHQLMEGSEIHVEPLEEVQKSPELMSRLKKLKNEQEQKIYNRMVKNVDPKWKYDAQKELGKEVRSTSKQLASIANFLLSIIGTFVFGYFASQYAFPAIEMRIIIGIVVAVVVAIAELYFMARAEI